MQFDPSKASLIVIDMQNSFCKPEGRVAAIGLDTSQCAAAIEPCAQVVASARAAGMPVIYTRYVYEPDYADGGVMVQHMMPELAECQALKAGSEDAEIVPELSPTADDIVIDKNRPSSFYGTRLDSVLAEIGRPQLLVCGVTTNCCVESTVRDASHRDMQVFVVGDACGELDEERHRVSLRTMGMLFGDIISVSDVAAAVSP
jgi:ureidoacrylate peracid hydrolase